MLEITWAHERFELFHSRALHWPDRRALILADPHFGKAETFRKAGVPVPTGTTAATLKRLTDAVRQTKPHRILILGDFFHSRSGVSGTVLQHLADWRRRHAPLEVINVRGNHDAHAGDPPPELDIECLDTFQIAGLRLVHHPDDTGTTPGQPVIAGHVHPVIKLDMRSDRMRTPCFHLAPTCMTLPAFGSFTGGKAVNPQPGDRVFAIGPDAVAEVPVAHATAYGRAATVRV